MLLLFLASATVLALTSYEGPKSLVKNKVQLRWNSSGDGLPLGPEGADEPACTVEGDLCYHERAERHESTSLDEWSSAADLCYTDRAAWHVRARLGDWSGISMQVRQEMKGDVSRRNHCAWELACLDQLECPQVSLLSAVFLSSDSSVEW